MVEVQFIEAVKLAIIVVFATGLSHVVANIISKYN